MAYAPPQFQQPQQYMQPGAPPQHGQQMYVMETRMLEPQPGMPPMMLPQQQQPMGIQPQIGMQPPQPGPAAGSAPPPPAVGGPSPMPGQNQAQVRVKLPENAYPGQQLDVPTPDGQTMRITVPPNVTGGHCITMQYVPKQPAPATYQQPPPQGLPPQQQAPPQAPPPQYKQPGQQLNAPAPPHPAQHSAASGSTQTCQTTLPPGAQPGQTLQVQTPDGYTVEIVVPGGAKSGQTITFQYLKP